MVKKRLGRIKKGPIGQKGKEKKIEEMQKFVMGLKDGAWKLVRRKGKKNVEKKGVA